MSSELIEHFRKYVEIDAEEAIEISNYFEPKTYNKKELLVRQDTRCNLHFFVLKGCLRLFYISEKGVEQTIQFAIENWWLTDYLAFAQSSNTAFSIQAIEVTDVLQIDCQQQGKLLNEFPQLERYFRLIFQRAYSASQHRTKYLYDLSREEFYRHFHENFPAFTSRIPQHLLASYLNMTPEYLSEIKKKMRS